MSFITDELNKKTRVAKNLYFSGVKSQDICIVMGITEKTLSLWVKKFRWKKAKVTGVEPMFSEAKSAKVYPLYWDFANYLQDKNPELLEQLEIEILNYLKS